MKTMIWIVTTMIIGFFTYKSTFSKQNKTNTSIELLYDTPKLEAPLNVTYFQDCSGSIIRNGVEVINSEVFAPYYNDTHRDIQLNFGIINELTSKKLIPLELKANRLCKPIMPDWANVPFESRNELKSKFIAAQQKYEADSIAYYTGRTKAIAVFRKQVGTIITPYLSQLSSTTDLVPAVKIADKIFNYCFAENATNYLLLNSDGQDSQNRHPQKLSNKAEVVLINANGNDRTSIDNLVTRSFQSTEQAIEFTLNNHN